MRAFGVFASFGSDKHNLTSHYFIVSADDAEGAKKAAIAFLKGKGNKVVLVTDILEIERGKEKWEK